MNDNQANELLLKLIEDISYIKGRLDTLDEIKLQQREEQGRLNIVEQQISELQKSSRSVENRCNTVEGFLRDQMNEQKATSSKIIGSTLLAVFSAVASAVIALLF